MYGTYGGDCEDCGYSPPDGHETTVTMYDLKFTCEECGHLNMVVHLDDWSD